AVQPMRAREIGGPGCSRPGNVVPSERTPPGRTHRNRPRRRGGKEEPSMTRAIRSKLVLATGMLVPANTPIPSAQPDTAGGKNAQATYTCVGIDPATNLSDPITVTVPYGRKGRVLLINAQARGIPGLNCSQALITTVGPADPESFGGSADGMMGGAPTSV